LSNVVDQLAELESCWTLSASRCRRLTKEERTREPLKSTCRYQAARAHFSARRLAAFGPRRHSAAAPSGPQRESRRGRIGQQSGLRSRLRPRNRNSDSLRLSFWEIAILSNHGSLPLIIGNNNFRSTPVSLNSRRFPPRRTQIKLVGIRYIRRSANASICQERRGNRVLRTSSP
jgi:hypothetical protein